MKEKFKIIENDNFENEFLEQMNEPLEDIPAEEENMEESNEEEERNSKNTL